MNKRKWLEDVIGLVTLADPYSSFAEQYRKIRSNIRFASVDRELKTIAVTSAGEKEGKSTTSANLAVVFADAGNRVLLVDADLRSPSLAIAFKLQKVKGLSSYLSDREADIRDYYLESGIENLQIMTSGPRPPKPSEMLGSQRMKECINSMRSEFDVIIFDLPPVTVVTDAQLIAAQTDGTILVVRKQQTNKYELAKAKQLLDLANAKIIGAVYNGEELNAASNYHYGGKNKKRKRRFFSKK
ncbi:CpsD/CapB family tyrosine-protein kinase [Enterococcus sp. AZ109]|uniref:CpsD/CapB family tyrosine-protein kinase n=1 Tax=Enterococcus sp. AZ109 TaxID=2774634 RepID=UPI003F251B90